ncbi:MAG: PaaI family thioesterase [Nitrospinota bacterium]
MSESLNTRFMRWGFNFFPAYRRTGGRITYIARDMLEVRIKLPLTWRTRNYVGTMFGGSMYAAIDPIYMVMFIKLLGPEYIVWDKSAKIQFKRPGRSTLRAKFVIGETEPEEIRQELKSRVKLDRTYQCELLDGEGTVCAMVEKVLHFSKKSNQSVLGKK